MEEPPGTQNKSRPSRDGTFNIPAVPPYLSDCSDISSRTLSCPVAVNGRRTRPGLLAVSGLSTGGSGGIFGKPGAPALTVPGSLNATACLLVSITAFARKPYHNRNTLSIFLTPALAIERNLDQPGASMAAGLPSVTAVWAAPARNELPPGPSTISSPISGSREAHRYQDHPPGGS